MGYILDTVNNTVYSEGDSYDGGILKYIKNVGADVGEPEFLIQVQRTDVVNDGNNIIVTPTAEILDDFVVWNSPTPPNTTNCSLTPLVNAPTFDGGDFELLQDWKVRIRFTAAQVGLNLEFCSEYTGGFSRNAQGYVNTATLVFDDTPPVNGYYYVLVNKSTDPTRIYEEVFIRQKTCTNYESHQYLTNQWGVGGNDGGGGTGLGADPRSVFIAETTNRRVNYAQFPTQAPVTDVYCTLGYGSPLYGSEQLEVKSGRIAPLLQGITNIYTVNMNRAYADKPQYWKTDGKDNNGYYFQQLLKMVLDWGRIQSSPEYGDTSGLLSQNSSTDSKNWYWPVGITAEGWRNIGAIIGANVATIESSSNAVGKWVTMDDETGKTDGLGQLSWGGRAEAVKWICEGIHRLNPNTRAIYYGAVPVTSFSGAILANAPFPTTTYGGVVKYDKSQYFANNEAYYETQIKTGGMNMPLGDEGYCASDYASYVGYPWIKGVTKYYKDGGNYVLNASGFRRYYDDNASRNITINSNTVELRTWQDPGLVQWYGVMPITGAQQYVDSVYRFANTLIERILVSNRYEKGSFDSWNNDVWKLNGGKDRRNIIGGVIRPMTENTKYSHYLYPQLCGDDFIEYFTWFCLLSGVTMLEIWEDDYIQTYIEANQNVDLIAQANAQNALNNNIGALNDTKHLKFLQCVNDFHKTFEGSDKSTWKFVRFYYPYVGELRREHIAVGVYATDIGKFCFFMTGPTLDTDPVDTCAFTLRIGNTNINETLSGGTNFIQVYDNLPNNLTYMDFALEYSNIYNQAIKVRGGMGTGNISEHYYTNFRP